MALRKIIHIDMDCFYAAVELKYRPELRGKPVAVGGAAGSRGVLTTANYEARFYGVRSAMTAQKALRLCPKLIILPVDFSKYRLESRNVRKILERYTTKVEPLSLDEAYLDVTNSSFESGSATRIAQRIRSEIRTETGLTASAGVAPNKFLAKVASDFNKPDGLKVIRPHEVDQFMQTLPVEKIWGVGKVTAEKLRQRGLRTCGELQALSLSELTATFGQFGRGLYGFSRGIDNRDVVNHRQRKSLSVEETFSRDCGSPAELRRELKAIYLNFSERYSRYTASTAETLPPFQSIVVKLRFSDFKHTTHERRWDRGTLPTASDFQDLLDVMVSGETRGVRLLGIGVRFNVPARRDTDASDVDDSGPQLRLTY